MASLRTTAVAALAAVAVLVVLPGCSDDEKPAQADPTESSAPDPVADAEAAVTAFYEDFAADDLPGACEWWIDDYAASSVTEWNKGGYGPQVSSCPELLGAIRDVFAIVGDPSELLQVTETSTELTDDTTARVEVALSSDGAGRETYELTLTDHGWRISGDDSE